MLRLAIVLGLVLVPAIVLAKPTVAVSVDNEAIRETVIEVLGETAKVVKLGSTSELDERGAERAQKKLGADAVVQGHVVKKAGKKRLKLTVFANGKKSTVMLSLKSSKLEGKLRSTFAKRLPKKHAKPRQREDEPEDTAEAEVTAESDDEPEVKDPTTMRERADRAEKALVYFDAGGSAGLRRLTYSGGTTPPRLQTTSVGLRIDAEIYPLANDKSGEGRTRSSAEGDAKSIDKQSSFAKLGGAFAIDKTYLLSVRIASGGEVTINKQQLLIGARYRASVGKRSKLVLGLDLEKRKYTADRSLLAAPGDFDAPDTNYTLIGPGVMLRTPIKWRSAMAFVGLKAMYLLAAGPVGEMDSYGDTSGYGVEAAGGLDIKLSKMIGVRFAGQISQITLKFDGNGAVTMLRPITSANDRGFGMAATLSMTY
ncbi:MAG: hypothetical protein ABI867_07330 [Kofleriaceae bacterium]